MRTGARVLGGQTLPAIAVAPRQASERNAGAREPLLGRARRRVARTRAPCPRFGRGSSRMPCHAPSKCRPQRARSRSRRSCRAARQGCAPPPAGRGREPAPGSPPRVDRVGDADEDALVRPQARGHELEHRFRVGLAGELEIERAGVEREQQRQAAARSRRRRCASSRGRRRGRCGRRSAASLVGREPVEHAVVQVDEAAEQPARRVELERRASPR